MVSVVRRTIACVCIGNKVEHAIDTCAGSGSTGLDVTSQKGKSDWLRRSPDPATLGQIICDAMDRRTRQGILIINSTTTFAPSIHSRFPSIYTLAYFFSTTIPSNCLTVEEHAHRLSQERNKIERHSRSQSEDPSGLRLDHITHTWPPPLLQARSPPSPLHHPNRANSAKSTRPPTLLLPPQKTSHHPKSAKHGPTSSPAVQAA